MPFARAFCDMKEAMKRSSSGRPQIPDPLPPAMHTLTVLQWEDTDFWQFADLANFYEYLRGCKYLRIPELWKPHFPKTLS